MVTGWSPLRATEGFTWLLTSGPCGISRGACKLALTSTIIKKTKTKTKKSILYIFQFDLHIRLLFYCYFQILSYLAFKLL